MKLELNKKEIIQKCEKIIERIKNVLRYLQPMDKETINDVFMNNQDEYLPYYNVIKWYYNLL